MMMCLLNSEARGCSAANSHFHFHQMDIVRAGEASSLIICCLVSVVWYRLSGIGVGIHSCWQGQNKKRQAVLSCAVLALPWPFVAVAVRRRGRCCAFCCRPRRRVSRVSRAIGPDPKATVVEGHVKESFPPTLAPRSARSG